MGDDLVHIWVFARERAASMRKYIVCKMLNTNVIIHF